MEWKPYGIESQTRKSHSPPPLTINIITLNVIFFQFFSNSVTFLFVVGALCNIVLCFFNQSQQQVGEVGMIYPKYINKLSIKLFIKLWITYQFDKCPHNCPIFFLFEGIEN